MTKKSVSIQWANLGFHVITEQHYRCDSFFEETIRERYLFHLPSVYGVKCLGEIYKQDCYLKTFCSNYYDSTNCQNLKLWIDFSKNLFRFFFFFFPKKFLYFWFNVIEKQSIIHLSCYRSKSYALVIPRSHFLGRGRCSFCPSWHHITVPKKVYNYSQKKSLIKKNKNCCNRTLKT